MKTKIDTKPEESRENSKKEDVLSASIKTQLKLLYIFAALFCVILVVFNFINSPYYSRNRGEGVEVFSLLPEDSQEAEENGVASESGGDESSSQTAAPVVGSVVNINTATAAQLEQLPGVGPSTAAKIIAYRDKYSGFKTVDELINVSGIGPAKLEQMRPYVTTE